MSQLSAKLSRCVTQRGKHSFAGFRLIFFRKDFLNSLPPKLTSESFMVDFCCQCFRRKTEE